MIHMTTRIYSWLMQMHNERTTWGQKKIDAEHDMYLEQTMHQYHGINVYAGETR